MFCKVIGDYGEIHEYFEAFQCKDSRIAACCTGSL